MFRCGNIRYKYKPGIQEPGAQYHYSLTGALFQLHLNCSKLLAYYGDHSLDFFGGYWTSTTLFSQQIDHMSCELITSLINIKQWKLLKNHWQYLLCQYRSSESCFFFKFLIRGTVGISALIYVMVFFFWWDDDTNLGYVYIHKGMS